MAKIQPYIHNFTSGCYNIGPYIIALSGERFSFLRATPKSPIDVERYAYSQEGSYLFSPLLSGHLELIEIFFGYKPSKKISKYGFEELIEYLRQKGLNEKFYLNMLLDSAAFNSAFEQEPGYLFSLIRHFIAQGVSPNSENEELDSPIITAVTAGRLDIAKWLAENGADTRVFKRLVVAEIINGSRDIYTYFHASKRMDISRWLLSFLSPSQINKKFVERILNKDGIKVLAYLSEAGLVTEELIHKITEDYEFMRYVYERGEISVFKYLCLLGLNVTAALKRILESRSENAELCKFFIAQGATYEDFSVMSWRRNILRLFSHSREKVEAMSYSFYKNLKIKEFMERI